MLSLFISTTMLSLLDFFLVLQDHKGQSQSDAHTTSASSLSIYDSLKCFHGPWVVLRKQTAVNTAVTNTNRSFPRIMGRTCKQSVYLHTGVVKQHSLLSFVCTYLTGVRLKFTFFPLCWPGPEAHQSFWQLQAALCCVVFTLT